MKNFRSMFGAVLIAALASAAPAAAQVVTSLPKFAAPGTVFDAGNGPNEFRMLSGSMAIFTSQGSGVGSTSGSSTSLTLTTTPLTVPCVGCIISGTGITSGTTVAAYSGTNITLSTPMTVASSTALAWGAACPSAPGSAPVALVQTNVGIDLPFYTQSRICAYGVNGPGGQFLQFAIGAH